MSRFTEVDELGTSKTVVKKYTANVKNPFIKCQSELNVHFKLLVDLVRTILHSSLLILLLETKRTM